MGLPVSLPDNLPTVVLHRIIDQEELYASVNACCLYSLGTELPFTKGGQGFMHLDEAWSHQEDWGIWSIGPRANIRFQATSKRHSDFLLTISFHVFIPPQHGYTDVSLLVNGTPLEQWWFFSFYSCMQKQVIVPDEVVTIYEHTIVTFVIDEPISQHAAGLSLDDREL
ncbi:MAG: hypothetical protein ABSB79_04720 [Syntrophales bacterium]|jgi:hypothetical protein